jgi:hypothetical protein
LNKVLLMMLVMIAAALALLCFTDPLVVPR